MQRFLKMSLITLATLVVMAVALGVFLKWARNPYGLEAERLGPDENVKLPAIRPVPNTKNYVLFSTYKGADFVIHLPVPNEYIHTSRTTTRFVRAYGAPVIMYYPGVRGKLHSSNANREECNGWCNGYIRAFVEVKEDGARVLNGRKLEEIFKDKASNNPLLHFEDLDRAFGLDDHFLVRYPIIEEKSNGDRSATKEYFLKREKNGGVRYLFECRPYTPSPSCGVKFTLSSRPEVVVDIHFSRDLLQDWEDIIRSADKTIVSWGAKRIGFSQEL